jgi:chromosome segregation ATPase
MPGEPWVNALTIAVVNLVVIGVPVWIGKVVLQRWIERRDRRYDTLEGEVTRLRDVRVSAIETRLTDHEQEDDERHCQAASSRKNVHEKLSSLDRDKVTWKQCRANHEQLIGQAAEMAKVGERVDQASKRIEAVWDQVVAVKGDVERMMGRMEGLRNGAGRG